MLDLDAIQARVDAATPGPWCWSWYDKWCGLNGPFGGILYHHANWNVLDDDAEFIAHARTDVPQLVAELRMLRDSCTDLIRHCLVDDTPLAHDALTQLAQLGIPVWLRRHPAP